MIAAASRGWRPYALLFLLCLGLYAPGIAALPVMDRDEARFAQATRQMLESGDFLHIRFQDEARNKKPAAIYWLQAASVAAFSDADSAAIWPYRLPSLLGAMAAVLLTFGLGQRLIGREAALLGAGLLAASVSLTVEAHLAKTDAVLLAASVAGQGALAAIYLAARDGRRAAIGWAVLLWAAEGAAILVKGPVAPILTLLTALALALADREARWLAGTRPLLGAAILAAIVAPWLVAISRATGGAFLAEAVGHDFLAKLFGGQESHGAWPGYYLLLVWVVFWPGSLVLAGGFAWAWRERQSAAARFLLAWAVPFWLALELTPTKLPHYLLPALPAAALIAARATLAAPAPAWLGRANALVWAAASLVIALTLAMTPFQLGEGVDAAGAVGAALILVLGVRVLRRAWHGVARGLPVQAALLALLVLPATLALEAPRLQPLWLSRSAAAMVAHYRPPAGLAVAAAGYAEPSLVFMLGTRTKLVSPEQAAESLTAARGAVALVEARDDAAFKTALAARGWQAFAIEKVAGLDYSNGKTMTLTLYRGEPG